MFYDMMLSQKIKMLPAPQGLSMEDLADIASFSVSRRDYGSDGDIPTALERFVDRFLKFGGHAFERYVREFTRLAKTEHADNEDIKFKEGPLTPLEDAEQTADLAFLTLDQALQVLCAQSALKKSRDCLGAYMILADRVTTNHEERLGFIRRGIAAGERTITPEQFTEYEGRFMEFDRGIAFIRAVQVYGISLMFGGNELGAIDAFYRVLQLGGDTDPAVVRKILVNLLLINDRFDEAENVMSKFAYGGAWWEYGRALLDFLKFGPGEVADKSLDAAFVMNPFVPPLLLREKRRPDCNIFTYTDGSEEEAVLYCDQVPKLWYEKYPTALEWFKERWKGRKDATDCKHSESDE